MTSRSVRRSVYRRRRSCSLGTRNLIVQSITPPFLPALKLQGPAGEVTTHGWSMNYDCQAPVDTYTSRGGDTMEPLEGRVARGELHQVGGSL